MSCVNINLMKIKHQKKKEQDKQTKEIDHRILHTRVTPYNSAKAFTNVRRDAVSLMCNQRDFNAVQIYNTPFTKLCL